jgi:prepilin-type N-terminal cleavage/methylation domain-containing protein
MRSNHGFTLVDVLVAAAILGITASALFGLLSRSLFNLRKVEDLHRYELAAQDVMNRVLFLPALPAPAVAEGTVDNLGGRWSVKITPWVPESLEKKPAQAIVKVDVIVSWPGRSSPKSIDVESLKVAKLDY